MSKEKFAIIESEEISYIMLYVKPASFWSRGRVGATIALKGSFNNMIYIEDTTPAISALQKATAWVKKWGE